MLFKQLKNILCIALKIIFLLFIVILQGYFCYYIFNQNSIYLGYIYVLLTILQLILIIYMINKQTTLEHVLLWAILLIAFPVIGIGLYVIFSTKTIPRRIKNNISDIHDNNINGQKDNNEILKDINSKDVDMYNIIRYINNVSGYSVRKCDINKYHSTGEAFYNDFLNDIKNAKKFIFINFFIIGKGKMLDEIIEILKDKANSGVKVFVIFDHMGSFFRYPRSLKKIKNNNLKVYVFNSFSSKFNLYTNIRNHRKIIVIDGNISYTGGINIGDEYINKGTFKAKWKDCAIRLQGDISNDFSSIFIKLWNMYCKPNERLDYTKYINNNKTGNDKITNEDDNRGYQIIYLDGVDTKRHVAKNVYNKLINDTKQKIYIMSPYLMLDNEILNNLKMCGRSGIDVRIITPKIGDNPFVHSITRSYYKELIENNVKIYEYIPGFIHSKTVLSDDIKASVSSINLDYRSMYFHYENGILIYNDDKLINEIKTDFINTINECEEIDNIWIKKHYLVNIFKPILKIIAPLM